MTQKIPVTQLQRDNALEALHDMWPLVPPNAVDKGLMDWRVNDDEFHSSDLANVTCDTVACFGGWVEVWPTFNLQLQKSSPEPKGQYSWTSVACLFGNPHEYHQIYALFLARGSNPVDTGFEGTDHELVTNRLLWIIKNTEVVK